MNDKQIQDKAFFVVGLLAAFLAFSTFKDDLSKIGLIIGNRIYPLFGIMIFFIILLTISVYLYALDYLRFNFGKYQNFFLFRWIIPLANFFYSFAMLFPILVIFFWIIGSEPFYGFAKQHEHAVIIFDGIAGSILAISSFFNAIRLTRRTVREATETIEKLKDSYLERALKLFDNKFYAETVIEAQKTLEEYLKEKLLEEKDLTTKYMGMRQLLDFADKNNIFSDKKYISLIKDLIGIRNKAVHSSDPITKEQAEFALEVVKNTFKDEGIKFTDKTDEDVPSEEEIEAVVDAYLQQQEDEKRGK